MIEQSVQKLISYCERDNFKGWDPYDGLNSRVFKLTPFKHSRTARLIWIQLFKKLPLNLRKLFLIKKEYNPKGLALMIEGYCNLYQLCIIENKHADKSSHIKEKIIFLSDKLLEIKNKEFSGDCWGYNFDWQARKLFFFPKHTPTIVPTAFCVSALINSYKITNNKKYLKSAISANNFVKKDLLRTKNEFGLFMSYSHISGNNTVINASLMSAKILLLNYQFTKNKNDLLLAKEIISSACRSQNNDGSWPYGLLKVQSWIDSFHTGYNLEILSLYSNISKDESFKQNHKIGLKYYLDNFFDDKGRSKYYNDTLYPIDIHSPAQLPVTLYHSRKIKQHNKQLLRVLNWTVKNMQNNEGSFDYQIYKFYRISIPYFRWSNAFMFYGLTFFMLGRKNETI